MRTLYHLWLDPFSRKVRVTMAEKGLEVLLTIESVWEKREKFLELNPAAEVPVLVEDDKVYALNFVSLLINFHALHQIYL